MKLFLILSFFFVGPLYAKTILFLGDSLTEGYQLDKEDAYPAVIGEKLKSEGRMVKIINGGVSGATTASGLKRLGWYLKAKPDVMVLALGANDGLRGIKLTESEKNLSSVIELAQKSGVLVILAGMKMPPNYGEPYRSEFERMFQRLAKNYQLKLIPFILEGVGGNPKLNLPDGIHPNPAGQKVMAENVLKILRTVL